VTEVLAQLVRDGGEQAQISVERLQKQVELHLEYSGGSLSRWKNRITSRIGLGKIPIFLGSQRFLDFLDLRFL
jgi:hypothetical protein